MNKSGFKIGDKVELIYPQLWSMGEGVGVITGFDEYIRVTWEGKDILHKDFPHVAGEIEFVSRPSIKGQQLVFSFMKQQRS